MGQKVSLSEQSFIFPPPLQNKLDGEKKSSSKWIGIILLVLKMNIEKDIMNPLDWTITVQRPNCQPWDV